MRTAWLGGLALSSAMLAPVVYGQTPGASFEAAFASVRPPGTSRFCQANVTRTPQRLEFQTSLVGDMMAYAYDVPLDRIERRPQWMYDECYDVALTTATPIDRLEQKRLLQTLLEERFGLVVRRVSHRGRVYHLLAGPNLALTAAAEPDSPELPVFKQTLRDPGTFPLQRSVYAWHASMGDLAGWLYQLLHVPVLDKTGLTGLYDIEFSTPVFLPSEREFISAVRDSLGVVIEAHEGTAETLIIEGVEKPKAN
jgi:uncharacterized protein (TIGR03435 family)